MTLFAKSLAVLPLAAILYTSPALAGHPDKTPDPTPQISAEALGELDFTDREIRIIREQIEAAQKRADGTQSNHPTKSLKQQLDDIELPSEAEIAEMQAQLPDLNAMMASIMKLATNGDMKNGMAKSADRLKEKLDFDNFETKDGLPDLNAMMSAMIALMGDEELVGGMIEAIEPFAEFMDDLAPDTEND